MGKDTAISWATHSWNPWMGCTKVSPGCARCYAEREHQRWRLPDFGTVRRSKTTFDAPLYMKEPAFVFTCSWSDFFHADADTWRDEAWAIIRDTPHLTYQILTKRPERIREHLPEDWGDNGYRHVWLGVSVENQRHAFRAGILAGIPARTRFISAEPLLGPVDLTGLYRPADRFEEIVPLQYIHWVIAGGESGLNHRPMDLSWAIRLRAQCAVYDVPFFMKQDAGLKAGQQGRLPDDLWATKEMPARGL